MKHYLVRGVLTLDVATVVHARDQHEAEELALCDAVAVQSQAMPNRSDVIVREASMRAREVTR